MAEENIEVIDLNEKTDLLATEVKCPICGDKYIYGVPYVSVPCKKCGQTYRTDFKQDIYTKKARYIGDKMAEKIDGVMLRATEEYKSALIHIRYNHIEQKCWDVSKIEQSQEQIRHCLKCGTCMNCFICNRCGATFERDKFRRKQACPSCHKSDLRRTFFKNTEEKSKNIRICPHCKSENIKLTLTKNKTKCHVCGSKKLTDMKINNIYALIIRKKKGYRK